MDDETKKQVLALGRVASELLEKGGQGGPLECAEWIYDLESINHPFLKNLWDELLNAYEHWPKLKYDASGAPDTTSPVYDTVQYFYRLAFTLDVLLRLDIELSEMEKMYEQIPFTALSEDEIREEMHRLTSHG